MTDYVHVQCMCVCVPMMTEYLHQGEMHPDAATGILVMFETKFNRLKEDRDNLMKAKDALELLDTGGCGCVYMGVYSSVMHM